MFISYSHDGPAHEDRVLAMADQLRAEGIDAVIDQYVQFPPEGWPAWCEAEIRKASFVLMVCTETYLRRVDGKEEPGKGHGVLWEARLIRQHLYDVGSVSSKFVPVLLIDGSHEHIPMPVRGGTIYRVEAPEGYEALYRLLTHQPRIRKPEIGKLRRLPERQRQWIGDPPPDKERRPGPTPEVEEEEGRANEALKSEDWQTRLDAVVRLTRQIGEEDPLSALAARLLLTRRLEDERDYIVRAMITEALKKVVSADPSVSEPDDGLAPSLEIGPPTAPVVIQASARSRRLFSGTNPHPIAVSILFPEDADEV